MDFTYTSTPDSITIRMVTNSLDLPYVWLKALEGAPDDAPISVWLPPVWARHLADRLDQAVADGDVAFEFTDHTGDELTVDAVVGGEIPFVFTRRGRGRIRPATARIAVRTSSLPDVADALRRAADHAEQQSGTASAARRLAAVEQLCAGRPGYHTITVKTLLTAMSDAGAQHGERPAGAGRPVPYGYTDATGQSITVTAEDPNGAGIHVVIEACGEDIDGHGDVAPEVWLRPARACELAAALTDGAEATFTDSHDDSIAVEHTPDGATLIVREASCTVEVHIVRARRGELTAALLAAAAEAAPSTPVEDTTPDTEADVSTPTTDTAAPEQANWIGDVRSTLDFNQKTTAAPETAALLALRDVLLDTFPRTPAQALDAARILLAAHTRALADVARANAEQLADAGHHVHIVAHGEAVCHTRHCPPRKI